MELNELQVGDTIVARYGSEYREMEVLANDTERQQITVNVRIQIGTFTDVLKMLVMEYKDYNLEKWGKLEKKEPAIQ
jgi:hypothetical protein